MHSEQFPLDQQVKKTILGVCPKLWDILTYDDIYEHNKCKEIVLSNYLSENQAWKRKC